MSVVNKLGICLSWKAQDGLCMIFFIFFYFLSVQKQTCFTREDIVEQQKSQLMFDTTGLQVNRQHIITKSLMRGY